MPQEIPLVPIGRRYFLTAALLQGRGGVRHIALGLGALVNGLFVVSLALLPLRWTRRLMDWAFRRRG